jgi:hypothetical protein
MAPSEDSIPPEFWNVSNYWNQLASRWFFSGLNAKMFQPVEGIDTKKAFRFLGALMGSFEPQHERKMATVGYLMSLWFKKPVEEAA